MTHKELTNHPIADELSRCARLFHRWRWSLSSSSNYSALLPSGEIIVSRSGVDKEMMSSAEFLLVDTLGKPCVGFETMRPSAETELHCHAYRHAQKNKIEIQSILHTHSPYSVYFSRKHKSENKVVFEGFEMQKIFQGVTTHASRVEIPIFANSQDMKEINCAFDNYLQANPWPVGYLIEGHGVYTWGSSVTHAKQCLEALEYLMEIKFMESK